MQILFQALYQVPDLIRTIFTGKFAVAAVAVTAAYLISLFLNNKPARVIREILVLAAVAAGVGAYFKRRYAFFWLMLILLAVLLLVRLLSYLLVTIRVNRRNRRIERKALEPAELVEQHPYGRDEDLRRPHEKTDEGAVLVHRQPAHDRAAKHEDLDDKEEYPHGIFH